MCDTGNMVKRPLVNVIIPTRNRAQLLSAALASVYAQEGIGQLFNLEVHVIDDASSDETPAIIQRYPGVQYHRLLENRGLAAARNVGLKASTGTFVGFLDDDDLWLPDKLIRQLPILEANPAVGIVYSQFITRYGTRGIMSPPHQAPFSGEVFGRLLLGNFIGYLTILARRTVFDRVGYFDERLTTIEDYDMWLRLARSERFMFVPGATAIYRYSPHGMLGTSVGDGRYERTLRIVLEKALASLPDSEVTTELKQKACAYAQVQVASYLMEPRRFSFPSANWAAARSRLLKAIRLRPTLLLSPGFCLLTLESILGPEMFHFASALKDRLRPSNRTKQLSS